MKKKTTISRELSKFLKFAGEDTVTNGGRVILLETVLYHLLFEYLEGCGEDEKLKKYLLELFGSNPKRKLTHIKKLSEEAIIETKQPDDLTIFTDANQVPASIDLDCTIERASRFVNQLKIDNKVTSVCLLLTSLFEKENPVVKYLYKQGISKIKIISLLGLGTGDNIGGTDLLEKALSFLDSAITSMSEEFSEDDKEEQPDSESSEDKNQRISDEFEKAGRRGSVSSKKIDPNSPTPFLDEFAFDMTKAAKDGKYDPVVGRDRELGSLIEILSCRKKNNAILLGEPGCGKTSIIEALVGKIARKEVPLVLQNKRVVSLDLNALVAGAIYRGEYEKRLQGIIKEVVDTKGIIVFIDEVHNLIGNGSSNGQGDGANILKPYLARGEFQIIGATTKTEYRVIEKDGALKRRFQNVIVEDPNVSETVEILNTVQSKYSEYHRVMYTPEILEICSKWSEKYVPDRH